MCRVAGIDDSPVFNPEGLRYMHFILMFDLFESCTGMTSKHAHFGNMCRRGTEFLNWRTAILVLFYQYYMFIYCRHQSRQFLIPNRFGSVLTDNWKSTEYTPWWMYDMMSIMKKQGNPLWKILIGSGSKRRSSIQLVITNALWCCNIDLTLGRLER